MISDAVLELKFQLSYYINNNLSYPAPLEQLQRPSVKKTLQKQGRSKYYN